MATERTWTLITGSGSYTYESVTGLDEGSYTFSFQKVSSMLYNMKNALVNQLGWTVVSCSYRNDGNTDFVNNTASFTTATTDQWTTGSNNFATGSIAPGTTAVSGAYQNLSSSVGRSWILLKHSGSFTPTMQENSGDFYHILLDFSSAATTNLNSTSIQVNTLAERQGDFGKGINIYVFPKEPTNPLGTPTPNRRPHDPSEITFYPAAGAQGHLQITDPTVSEADRLHILYEAATKGFIFLITGGGEFRAFFAMNTFSDHYSSQDGKVFSMGYSQIGNTRYKLNSAYGVNYLYARGSATAIANTSQLCIRGVRTYSAGNYDVTPFITCFPAYTTSALTTWLYLTANKKTLDNTYVEWPLPVLDITNISTSTYYFKGRIPDIKLGPANGADGVMSKPTAGTDYDRVLLSGLWFPWASENPIEL
jgi:hypothetical protein